MQGSGQELREKAHRKAKARYRFRTDAAAYALADAFLVRDEFPWFVFVLGG